MNEPVPRDIVRKVRKLAQLPQEARRSQLAVSVTRLTILKSLCRHPDVANRFVTFLARKTLARLEQGKKRSSRPRGATSLAHREMMSEALAAMEAWQRRRPSEELRQGLRDLLERMQAEQNEYTHIRWGAVRIITDWELLLFERAVHCHLGSPDEAGHWAYQMARDYAERYDSSHGTGLTPASAALVQDIVDFWMREFDLDAESLAAPAKARKQREKKVPAMPGKQKARFTHRQGQFLAFIHLYRKLHRQGPAELDMVRYFRVTPPAVHDMVVRLEQLGLVARKRGAARSVRVAIPEKEIPPLEDVVGPPS